MTEIAHLLGEFIAAWNQGQRPRMAAYLERAAPNERDELADRIETFLTIAPDPVYDGSTWAEMVSDPMIERVAHMSMGAAEPLPLPALRERAGLSLGQLAAKLGFSGASAKKAAGVLEEIESGRQEPRAFVLERIAEVLRVPRDAITAALPSAPPATGMAFRKGEGADVRPIDFAASAALSDDDEWDEVDDFFLGPRDEA